jgi:hypothetical protein
MSSAVVAAIDACPGPLYNRYDDGGFLIWFAPGRPVFLDSRQDPYPPALIHEQIAAERTGDYRSLFARYQIGCAFEPPDSTLVKRLIADGWTASYAGRDWVVLNMPRGPQVASRALPQRAPRHPSPD